MYHEHAALCANISKAAYLAPKEFKAFLFKKVIIHKSYQFFDNDGAQAYIVETPHLFVIAFRGTQPEQISDIVADIKAWPTTADTSGLVHTGFKTELDKIYDEILTWYVNKDINKPILITGHSLGGAMATLFTSRLTGMGEDMTLYTYGSPRVGNKTWAKQMSDVTAYRFQNTNDVVCKVPWGFYRHVGTLLYLTYDGKFKKSISWKDRIIDNYKGRKRAWQKNEYFSGFYDHDCTRYINKILNYKK